MGTRNFYKHNFLKNYYVLGEDFEICDFQKLDISKINYKNIDIESYDENEIVDRDRNFPMRALQRIVIRKYVDGKNGYESEELYCKIYYGYRNGYYESNNLDIMIYIDAGYGGFDYALTNEKELNQEKEDLLECYNTKQVNQFFNCINAVIKEINKHSKKVCSCELGLCGTFSDGSGLYFAV